MRRERKGGGWAGDEVGVVLEEGGEDPEEGEEAGMVCADGALGGGKEGLMKGGDRYGKAGATGKHNVQWRQSRVGH